MATETLQPNQLSSGTTAENTRTGRFYRPTVDIIEQGDELVIVADMPGVSGDQVDINFEDGALTIHGRVQDRQEASVAYLLQEYGLGDFYRVFQVSEAVDPTRITAELSDGVLTLHLPKAESMKARKIAVQAK